MAGASSSHGGLQEDEFNLIRQYLIFRGLSSTAKAFDSELKLDRDKAFRVDRVMEQLHSYINSYDIIGLRDFWTFLETHLFSLFDVTYSTCIQKLSSCILRVYLVNAIQCNRQDKVMEFFEKLAGQLQNQNEWKDWFVLPFVKNAEENPAFMMYFSKQWQDTVFLSLYNFLSIILSNVPKPNILNYEEDHRLISRLEAENAYYRHQLTELKQHSNDSESSGNKSNAALLRTAVLPPGEQMVMPDLPPVDPFSMPGSVELMDDFYAISQAAQPPVEKPSTRNSVSSFIRNIALPSSPILSKKNSSSQPVATTSMLPPSSSVGSSSGSAISNMLGAISVVDRTSIEVPTTNLASQVDTASEPPDVSPVLRRSRIPSSSDLTHENNSVYMVLSQDEYKEHTASIAQCRFSASGQTVATLDVDGVLKTWTIQPSPKTIASTMSKSVLTTIEWATSADRLTSLLDTGSDLFIIAALLLGSKVGGVRLFDVREKKIIKEVTMDSSFPRVIAFASHPQGTSFTSSAVGRLRASGPSSDTISPRVGRLTVWDLKTMKTERHLTMSPGPIAVNCLSYNHNGQLLLTGAADGYIRLYDLKVGESIAQWQAHAGDVYTALFSSDENCCYSMGADGQLTQWSINKTGRKMADLAIHPGASGPFVSVGVKGQKEVQMPGRSKLFALDSNSSHMLTCSAHGGVIYKLDPDLGLVRSLSLEGHSSPVVCVDWAESVHCNTCLTASMDGRIRVSPLLTR